MKLCRVVLGAAALAPLLGGCAVVSDVAGLAVGGGAAAATGNPAVGFAVGIGSRAAFDSLRKYVVRRRQQGEQDAIAEAAGTVLPGESRAWEIRHTIPIDNARGDLLVTREFVTPLATCREVIFSVADEEERQLFTTTLCRQDEGWKWAADQPAVDRWGALQ